MDTTKAQVPQELSNIVNKFAEHFHDSWASRKLDKGWKHGEIYSRNAKLHPRLSPFHMLKDFEKGYYKERCAECLRALAAWDFSMELQDHESNARAEKAAQPPAQVCDSAR